MAAKKTASKRRSATKRGKTTRSAPKRTAKSAPVDATPTMERAGFAEPAAMAAANGDRPSRFTDDHYLHAAGPQAADGLVRRPGKWLIFVSRSRIDALWEDVRRAVQSGRLGHAAKVSTALPDPLSPNPKKHVIWVYTADEDDPADVRRVRDALRQLGVTWKIPYKTDTTTGDPAAKYYE